MIIISNYEKYEMCPVCTVAVAAGLGLSRWLKIDDTISGLWAGALVVALTLWTIGYLAKKRWTFPCYTFIIALIYFSVVLVPLFYSSVIGHSANTIWGIDKFSIGTVIGAIVLAGSLALHFALKNNIGRSYFPLQKVVIPVFTLLLFSGIFYILTK